MEDTAPTAEKALFLTSALTGLLGLTVFASMVWESSPYRNGISDKLVPLSLLITLILFPILAYTAHRLYKKCRDTFSKSLRTIIILWQTISLLAWCLAIGVLIFSVFVWLSGNFMWQGGNVTPPSWSPFA
jgi:hypothetical protein